MKWWTKDGQELEISEMSTEHIHRALYHMMRNLSARLKVYSRLDESSSVLDKHRRLIVDPAELFMKASNPLFCFKQIVGGQSAGEMLKVLRARGEEFNAGQWCLPKDAKDLGLE